MVLAMTDSNSTLMRPPVTLPSGEAPRVLVVDDEPLICAMNAELLLHAGYRVDSAENGAVAWAALQAADYDLVITDHNMPHVTGVELLESMHAAGMDMPVIMVTGAFPHDQLTKRPWLTPTATVHKPYSYDHLLELVKNVLCTHARTQRAA